MLPNLEKGSGAAMDDDTGTIDPHPKSTIESEPPLPFRVGKYRVLAKLGQGGMAVVHLAAALGPSGFSKLLVLKTLRNSLAQDPQSVQSFLKEARLAARLSHPNVVQTYEVTQEEDTYVIVMEYLEGAPLATLRKKVDGDGQRVLPLATHLSIITDALSGLQHAHELRDFSGTLLGVVHRDLSANNIFVTFDGAAKLLDFGIAKAANQQHTNTGLLRGTIRYMAPETILSQAVDRRADLFAAGVLIWEAATGARIWEGETDVAVMHRIVSGDFPSARETNPEVSEELDAICKRAMAFDRADRYQTADELRKDLQTFLTSSGELDTARARLAPLMTETFGPDLTRRRKRIDTQLARLEKSSAQDSSESIPYISLDTTTDSNDDASFRISKRKLAISGAVLLAAAAVAITALTTKVPSGALSSGLHRNGAMESAANPRDNGPRAQQRTREAARPAVENQIHIRLRAVPPNATLYLGEERLPGNPAVLTRPKDGSEKFFRAEAPGYMPGLLNLRMDNNVDVMLVLNPAPAPATEPQSDVDSTTRTRRPSTRANRRETPSPTTTEAAAPPPAPVQNEATPRLDRDNPWGR